MSEVREVTEWHEVRTDPRQRAEYLAASKADAALADWRPSDIPFTARDSGGGAG